MLSRRRPVRRLVWNEFDGYADGGVRSACARRVGDGRARRDVLAIATPTTPAERCSSTRPEVLAAARALKSNACETQTDGSTIRSGRLGGARLCIWTAWLGIGEPRPRAL